MGYFPEGVVTPQPPHNPLRPVVKLLSVKAKKAMYAASQKGLIKRGTWDGCAFNAAGGIMGEGDSVASFGRAAEIFDMPISSVQAFITVWDGIGGSDEHANRLLVEALTETGLAVPPGQTRGKRIIRGYAYKSEATKFQEQLESGELTVDMIPGCSEAIQLLSV